MYGKADFYVWKILWGFFWIRIAEYSLLVKITMMKLG